MGAKSTITQMEENRQDFNRHETQRYIRKVFLSLYTKNGLDGVAVNELCRQAGIAKSTFYSYYDDKYSVLEAIEDELLEGLEEINKDRSQQYMNSVIAGKGLSEAPLIAQFLKDHLEEFRAIMGPKGDVSFETRWRAQITEKVRDIFAKENKVIKKTELACAIFTSSLMGVFRYLIFVDQNIPTDVISAVIEKTLKYTLLDLKDVL